MRRAGALASAVIGRIYLPFDHSFDRSFDRRFDPNVYTWPDGRRSEGELVEGERGGHGATRTRARTPQPHARASAYSPIARTNPRPCSLARARTRRALARTHGSGTAKRNGLSSPPRACGPLPQLPRLFVSSHMRPVPYRGGWPPLGQGRGRHGPVDGLLPAPPLPPPPSDPPSPLPWISLPPCIPLPQSFLNCGGTGGGGEPSFVSIQAS